MVGFHHTSTFMSRLMPTEQERAHLKRGSAAELALYAENNLPASFLVSPVVAIQPVCFRLPSSASADDSQIVTRFTYLVPTRAFIDGLRQQPLKGWWPSSIKEVIGSLAGHEAGFQGRTFLYGDPVGTTELPDVPVCS